jgi:plasmid stabilization system protein ParE
MKPVRFLQPAEQEMLNAAQYYELQVPGLGASFLDKIDSATADISEHPERWPIVRLNIRRRLIHRFPYGLLYRIDSNEVVVLAVSHLHRHPSYWIGRTASLKP